VKVRFATKKLERCYLDSQQATRFWGPIVARRYIQRIDILQEAGDMEAIRELPGLACHQLKGDKRGLFALILHGRWRLEFSLTGEKPQTIYIEKVSKHYGD
jgi:proteic killer suppression protein